MWEFHWSQQIPTLPTRFTNPAKPVAPGLGSLDTERKNRQASTNPGFAAADQELYLVVTGESSALGEPYHPWLSVGQLVGWQLERVFPGRRIRVELRAAGGLRLEQAVRLLSDLQRRPDAIIVFAGHNEFQGRYGWSRNVCHYVEEGPESPLALLGWAVASATTWMILTTIDLYYGEAAPPRRVTRELVDHPTCTPREYAVIRDDFQLRLDKLTEYCMRIGSLPILIVPGSNDGSFDPSRSVLAGSTPTEARGIRSRIPGRPRCRAKRPGRSDCRLPQPGETTP